MHNVPGFDHQPASTLRAKARQDILARYDTIKFEDVAINSVKRLEDGTFEAVDARGGVWKAPKVILATGVRDLLPPIPGYEELWKAHRIFHCLFCSGYEDRGGPSVGVLAVDVNLADPFKALHVAHMAGRLAERVRIYTDGNNELASNITGELKSEEVYVIEPRKVVKLSPSSENPLSIVVHLEDGTEFTESFIAHTPRTEVNGPFAQQLGLELTPMGDIQTFPPFQTTSMPGVFAAGDCGTMIKSVLTAMMHGGLALVGATARALPPMPK